MAASKFTPETRGALLERFAAGVSLADAARTLDLREPTVKGWLTRGRRESTGLYAEFVQAVEIAREEARNRPEPMDEDELRRVVSETARKGSVQAMKLMWEMILADRQSSENEKPQPEQGSVEALDELAELRATRSV